ncbi:hypothetical protein BH20ACI2_BH20ACI2_26750 [soil metagenome]
MVYVAFGKLVAEYCAVVASIADNVPGFGCRVAVPKNDENGKGRRIGRPRYFAEGV